MWIFNSEKIGDKMNIQELKDKIIMDDKIECILKEIGMTNIKKHSNYYSSDFDIGAWNWNLDS